jgi:UDP-N-acetylmuramoyl-L-alanyl-D-glutamate--2,6-diaminopimelate ligase
MDTVVFLNLSRDHIDYHQSLEAYFKVKQRLFTGVLGTKAKKAIVNLDCAYGQRILETIGSDLQCLTFSAEGQSSADFKATSICLSAEGTSFELLYPEGSIKVSYPLLGRHNVANVLAALAIGYAQGRSMDKLLNQLKSFSGVPGRMERVNAGQDFNVLVDYAHTGDAIKHSGEVIQEFTDGQKIIVFGCGGNRDKGKRPLMMRAALDTSDVVIATSDNPRTESIEAIFEDMKAGIESEAEAKRVLFIKDRRNAIAYAFELAKPKDCILIAGKGHEMYQELEGRMIPFDDRKVAKDLIEKRFRLDQQ